MKNKHKNILRNPYIGYPFFTVMMFFSFYFAGKQTFFASLQHTAVGMFLATAGVLAVICFFDKIKHLWQAKS